MNSIDKFKNLKKLQKLKVAYQKELMIDSFDKVGSLFSTATIIGDVLNVLNSSKNIYDELQTKEE